MGTGGRRGRRRRAGARGNLARIGHPVGRIHLRAQRGTGFATFHWRHGQPRTPKEAASIVLGMVSFFLISLGVFLVVGLPNIGIILGLVFVLLGLAALVAAITLCVVEASKRASVQHGLEGGNGASHPPPPAGATCNPSPPTAVYNGVMSSAPNAAAGTAANGGYPAQPHYCYAWGASNPVGNPGHMNIATQPLQAPGPYCIQPVSPDVSASPGASMHMTPFQLAHPTTDIRYPHNGGEIPSYYLGARDSPSGTDRYPPLEVTAPSDDYPPGDPPAGLTGEPPGTPTGRTSGDVSLNRGSEQAFPAAHTESTSEVIPLDNLSTRP